MSRENSALVANNYERLPKEAKKTTDSSFDRIYKYYHNSKTRVELTDTEHAIRERLEKAWLLLCRHRTRKQVVELICKLFHVEKSVAYDDVRNAMLLFSNPQEDMEDAKRAIAENNALRGMDKCWKDGDMLGYHKFNQQYIELNKLDKDHGADVGRLVRKLKPHQVIIVSSTEQLERESEAIEQEVMDIPHEDAE